MEETFRQVSTQNLECPVCLSIFSEPKILSCSHTYCKNCLGRLLDCQVGDQELPCPVCRKKTSVPSGDVGQLQANIALRSLVEDVKNQEQKCTSCRSEEKFAAVVYCQDCSKYLCISCQKTHSEWDGFCDHQVVTLSDISSGKVSLKRRRKCKKHQNEDEECFCSDCKNYVCFKCGVMEHAQLGHQIKEASVYEESQGKNIVDLQNKSQAKEVSIKAYIKFIEEQKQKLRDILKQRTDDISKACEESIQRFISSKESLIDEVEKKIGDLEADLEGMKAKSQQDIARLTAMSDLVGNGMKVPLEKEALAAHDMLCQELKGVLEQKEPDYDQPRKSGEKGEQITVNLKQNLDMLSLGTIQIEKNAIQGVLGGNSKWVAKEVDLNKMGNMSCMAPTPDGSMAVGFNTGGIRIYSANGELQQTVLEDEDIFDVGFASGGRFFVLNTRDILSVYKCSFQFTEAFITFVTLSGIVGGYGNFTFGSNEQIYVGYTKASKIQVFTSDGGEPVREIQCTGYQPSQIFAVKSSKMLLISTDNSLRLITESGVVKHTNTKSGVDIAPCCCASRDGSIIVAWVMKDDGLVSIDRYTSELKHMQTLIKDQKIQKPKRHWYYMQEFLTGEIAFCTIDKLYIFSRRL